MRNWLFTLFIIICSAGSAQEGQGESGKLIEIITTDDVEYLGVIIAENDTIVTLKAPSGIIVQIPVKAIASRMDFHGDVKKGKVWRPDPNKSMYLFAPSAFPIESGNSYCRDFCLVFPSYNVGVGDAVSIQIGAFWFPGMLLDQTPLIASGKLSFLNLERIRMAAGIMYLSFPSFDEGNNFGTGFTFITGTLGNRFSHFSGSFGWGFVQVEGDWEFMERPILVLAGNQRMSNTSALIAETWIIPSRILRQLQFY